MKIEISKGLDKNRFCVLLRDGNHFVNVSQGEVLKVVADSLALKLQNIFRCEIVYL